MTLPRGFICFFRQLAHLREEFCGLAEEQSASLEACDRLLRTETCINDTYHLAVGRRVENLPVLRERMAATNLRYLESQSELLASTVDSGQLAALAQPTLVVCRG